MSSKAQKPSSPQIWHVRGSNVSICDFMNRDDNRMDLQAALKDAVWFYAIHNDISLRHGMESCAQRRDEHCDLA